MLKSEFNKIHKQKYFIILSVILLIIPLATQLIYSNFVTSPAWWSYRIQEYKSIEEIDDHILDLQEVKENLDKSLPMYEDEEELLNDSIRIYEFLKLNNINFDDVINFGLYDLARDSISFLSVFSFIVILTMFVIIALLCVGTINSDFSFGIANFVYCGKNIKKRLLAKLATIIITSFVCLLFFILCIIIFQYSFDFQYNSILFVSKNNITVLSNSQFLSQLILGVVLDYIIVIMLSIMLSMFSKKSRSYILIEIAVVFGIAAITFLVQNKFLASYVFQYILALSFGYGGWKYALIFSSKFLVLLILDIMAFKKFTTRNLL